MCPMVLNLPTNNSSITHPDLWRPEPSSHGQEKRSRPFCESYHHVLPNRAARPLHNTPFRSISVSGLNFNPQNTQCIPFSGVVKIFVFPSRAQALRAGGLNLNKIGHFSKVSPGTRGVNHAFDSGDIIIRISWLTA